MLASGDLWGGAEAQLQALAIALEGHRRVILRVVLFNDGVLAERLRDAGIDTDVLDESTLGPVRLVMALRERLRACDADVLHTHGPKENILGGIAAYTSDRVPSVRTVHGADEHGNAGLRRNLVRWLDHLAGRHLHARVVAVSKPLRDNLADSLRRPVTFIANGIDIARFADKSARYRQGDPAVVHIGFVGRLVPVKRLDLFLDIAQLVVSRHAQAVHFDIFGSGPESEFVRSRIDELKLGERVTMHGFVDDVREVLTSIDMLLITSDHEGLPMVILEASAMATPVLSRRVGEIAQVIDDGNGLGLVDSAEPEAFAAKIDSFVENPGPYADAARSARRRVTELYTSDVCASRYLEVFDDVVAARRQEQR